LTSTYRKRSSQSVLFGHTAFAEKQLLRFKTFAEKLLTETLLIQQNPPFNLLRIVNRNPWGERKPPLRQSIDYIIQCYNRHFKVFCGLSKPRTKHFYKNDQVINQSLTLHSIGKNIALKVFPSKVRLKFYFKFEEYFYKMFWL